MPYKCWIETQFGRIRARFVPYSRIGGSTAWGPVFLGNVYATVGARRAGDQMLLGRYFADELDPWEAI